MTQHYDLDALIAAAAAALPALLRLFWVLAAGAVTVTVLPVPHVPQAFKDAVRLSAARGKLWDSKPAALGPLRDWAVPQRWFLHFYLVGIAATAATLGAFGCALGRAAAHDSSSSGSGGSAMIDAEAALSLLGLALFLVHVTRRAAETALLMRYPPDAAMHGIAYAFGLSYYAVAPLSLVPGEWFAAALPPALGLGSRGSGSGGALCTVSTVTSGAAAAAAAVRSGGPVVVALAVVVSVLVLGCCRWW
jgi:3-oxo-5-alpha-steroid 4-dehydrogenase 3